jgi:hypothetical protein
MLKKSFSEGRYIRNNVKIDSVHKKDSIKLVVFKEKNSCCNYKTEF